MNKVKSTIIYSALCAGSLLPFFDVQAASSTSTLNVGLTIPSSGTSPTGISNIQPPTDNPPSISNTVANPASTTVVVTWSANDDNGISSVVFNFGTTLSYGSTGTVIGSYQTDISGLTPNTAYFFKISVTDSAGHITEQAGVFTTQPVADIIPPNISAVTSLTGVTTATVQWNVDEQATGQISYGLTPSYGLIVSSGGSALVHSVSLISLLSNTTYHYRLTAVDAAGNSSSTIDAAFITSQDIAPPANPGNVTAATTTDSIVLSWTNPLDSDFSGVTIVRKTSSPPTSRIDGTTIYTDSEQTFIDATVSGNVTYYYSLFSFDTSNNYSSGANVNGRVTVSVVNEVCGNGLDDDRNGAIDCADSVCASYPACQPKQEVCNNSIDDNINGLTDCADPVCSGANYCAALSEVCNNTADDDGNGKIDCDDVACFAFSGCKTTTPTDYQPSASTISDSARITLADIQFLGASRTVLLQPSNGKVTSLAGTTLTIGVKKSKLAGTPSSVVLVVDGNNRYQMALNEGDQTYYADSIFPRVGTHMSGIEIDYGNTIRDNVSFTLEGLSYGTVSAGDNPLDGAVVVLLDGQNKAILGYTPTITTVNGFYGLVVPNGSYSIKVSKKGFYDRISPNIFVSSNVINTDFSLIDQPPDLLDAISSTSTLAENVGNIAKNISLKTKAVAELSVQKIKDTAEAVQKFKEDPVVQEQASQVVAPTAVTVTAVSTIAIASWGNLIPFLRLLFLQPLLLLGLRRRKGWGQVYNTLNKMPVDLATLRLVSAETGRVIQSKVTDKEGRYAFVVNPGKYAIQVVKNGFAFPSFLLGNAKNDGRRTDIYHGEIINVTANDAVITANIPLDPIGNHKRPIRIFWQRLGRATQVALSWLGLLVTALSLYISPRWYVWVLFGIHILFFIIFRRLAIPKKIKSWGIAYDSTSKKPVGRVVARLFNSEFNKLVATQITDGSGRYYFLASDDKYYVTYDHSEYAPEKTNILDLGGKEAENIAVDVGLTKSDKPVLPTEPSPIATAIIPAPVITTPPTPPAPSATAILTPTTARVDLNNPPEPPAGA